MAGDWMKIELELPDKPEVHYIAGALNLDPDAVVGKLMRVWSWFDKHTTDGNALGVTYSLIDRITGATGFGEAMQFAGWLEQRDKTLVMPAFDKHTSKSAKERALTAKRVAKSRNGGVTPEPLAREEKRREEEKKERTPRQPKTKSEETTLRQWVEALAGADAVPADDPIFDWAGKQGIPGDWIGYAWAAFEDRYADKDRRYTDWRAAFRDHVKRGWLDIWRVDQRNGGFVLTTAGEQWRREVTA
jgi:hypothetical protein